MNFKGFYIYVLILVFFLGVSGIAYAIPVFFVMLFFGYKMIKRMSPAEVYESMGINWLKRVFKNNPIINDLTEE